MSESVLVAVGILAHPPTTDVHVYDWRFLQDVDANVRY